MVRTKTIQPAPDKRVRRSEAQLIADLESKIQRLKTRVAARAIKKNPSLKHTTNAVRSIDLALSSVSSPAQRQALTDARSALVAYLQLEGIKIPKQRGPRRKLSLTPESDRIDSSTGASENRFSASS